MREYVVYIGDFSPSRMDAQTQLVLGNCAILKQLGFTVTLVCNDTGFAIAGAECGHGIVNGYDCYSFRFDKSIEGFLNSNKLFGQLEAVLNQISPEKIAFIFCYGSIGFGNQLLKLSKWCKKRDIKIIGNCVDLPNVNHGRFVERVVKVLDRGVRNYATGKCMDGLIAVSSYIADYFSQKNRYPIVIIPPLKDTKKLEQFTFSPRESLKKIVYVGVPFPIDGRQVGESAYKDRIDLFIDLLCSSASENWRLDIYGMTQEQYMSVITRQVNLLKQYEGKIFFHGRVDHNEAMRIVADADYSVVYRLKNRMTMAGFSTKFVESISCGTPVLMTDTSEYMRYAERGIP